MQYLFIDMLVYMLEFFTIGTTYMALPVMEFQDQGYKIRKIFA